MHTDKQTNKQINAGKNIYLLAEVNNNYNNNSNNNNKTWILFAMSAYPFDEL